MHLFFTKSILACGFVSLLATTPVDSQFFIDPALQTQVRSALGEENGSFRSESLDGLRYLMAGSASIASLQGLEQADNLDLLQLPPQPDYIPAAAFLTAQTLLAGPGAEPHSRSGSAREPRRAGASESASQPGGRSKAH